MENEVMPAGGALVSVGGAMTETSNGAVAVSQSAEMAMTLARVQAAQAFPRNVMKARDNVLAACIRPKLAEAATYKYSRGGTDITGPSIRLAEALAQSWGNIDAGVRELERRGASSVVETFAHDLQTNTLIRKVFQVSHVRHTKKGDTILTDPRDVYELVANNASRRLRACILQVIPGDIVEEALEQCENTLKATVGDEATLKKKVRGIIKAFEKYGVNTAMIEARIQRHIEAIDAPLYLNLVKIGNSLKDGMSKPEDWFDMSLADKKDEGGDKGNGENGNGGDGGEKKQSEVDALNAALGVNGLKRGSDIKPPVKKPANAEGGENANAEATGADADKGGEGGEKKPIEPEVVKDPNSLF